MKPDRAGRIFDDPWQRGRHSAGLCLTLLVEAPCTETGMEWNRDFGLEYFLAREFEVRLNKDSAMSPGEMFALGIHIWFLSL